VLTRTALQPRFRDRTRPELLYHLASAHEAAGRIAEAIPLFEESLDDRLRVLGGDHPG
jgi:hypothetical protein